MNLQVLPGCLGSQMICFNWVLSEDGEEQTGERQLLYELESFLTMSICILPEFSFQKKLKSENMKYRGHYICVEHPVIYIVLFMYFINWQRERSFKKFWTHVGAGICKVTPDAGEGRWPDTKGGWGVHLCVHQDGWKHFPSMLPFSALLMTSALAWGTNIP